MMLCIIPNQLYKPYLEENEMKINMKELLLRVIILMIGLTIAHLGVTLFILADLGSDPFNVLVQGIFRTVSKICN